MADTVIARTKQPETYKLPDGCTGWRVPELPPEVAVIYPVCDIRCTWYFGYYTYTNKSGRKVTTMHYGWDNSNLQPITDEYVAPVSGVVDTATWNSASGYYLVFRRKLADGKHDLLVVMKHLAKLRVARGDTVTIGRTAVGKMGNTGTESTAKHLHMEALIVPTGTAYQATPAFRSKYAIDVLSIAQATEYQSFAVNYKTFNKRPLMSAPSRYTRIETSGKLKIISPTRYMRAQPLTDTEPRVGGEGRAYTLFKHFTSLRSFDVTAKAIIGSTLWVEFLIDGYPWWTEIEKGYSSFEEAAPPPPATQYMIEVGPATAGDKDSVVALANSLQLKATVTTAK